MKPGGFRFKRTIRLVQASGALARSLEELLAEVESADDATLFYHVYEAPLRDPGASEAPPDHFTAWCEHVLMDREAAERLAFAALFRAPTMVGLRATLLGALGQLCRSGRGSRPAPEGRGLGLQCWQTLALESGMTAADPAEAVECVAALGAEEFLYHLREVPLLDSGSADDLLYWLEGMGAVRMARAAAPERSPATGLRAARSRVLRSWRSSGIGLRIAERGDTPEARRPGEAREMVSRLLRDWGRGGELLP
ncbi:MAG: hypothetical protein HZB25_09690 [Candidatus Eisenbacteria bacterium]|nr:hypothetical protein [Candidatus Eisenbacteria bacterium]